MDSISIERLKLVHPELSRRVYLLDEKLLAEGIRFRVMRGLATFPEQEAIYEQGRTTPGMIVTNAKPGWSGHNFGYAIDGGPDDPAFPAWHPDWNVQDQRWRNLLAAALECGLAEGAMWRSLKPDNPHFYLKELPATPGDDLRAILQTGGIEAVFREIDALLGIPKGA